MATCHYLELTGAQAALTDSGDPQSLAVRTLEVTELRLPLSPRFPLQRDNRGWGVLVICTLIIQVATVRELYG